VTAVVRAARGGLGGRRLQAIIICLVVLAATAASTLALGMLADAHSPFDHAFAAQRGADVTVTVDTSVATLSQLTATTRLAGVTAAAGPFREVSVTAQLAIPGVAGSSPVPEQIAGRSSPGGPVDDLTLTAGHWPRNENQIVLSEAGPGTDQLGSTLTVGSHRLTVVGLADSVTNTAQAWVLPAELTALARRAGGGQAEMLYRFANAGTSAAIAADIAAVRAALPQGAVQGTATYLAVRQSEQSSIAPWVPFIIAFGLLALVISVLIVINVVGGAVIAGTTRIGVLKSIGFTPAQVVASYVLLVAVPAVLGCVIGVVCGDLLAVPLLRQNAQIYQVGTLGVPVWVEVAVPLAVLALTAAGAVPPALRAGRMSAVQAIATGRAPRPTHGYIAHRALARLGSLPRAVTLGLAAPSARPARTLVTAAAVVFGAVAVTFGAGLATSLTRAYADISQSSLSVRVLALPSGAQPGPAAPSGGKHGGFKPTGGGVGGPGPGALTAAQQRAIMAALAAQPDTLHYVSAAYDQLGAPGLIGGLAVTAYGGDPAWSGLALISGRWYSRGAEVDVNTLFLTDTGTSVGSVYTLSSGGQNVTVRIVGEVFQPGNGLDMYLSPATLAAVDPGVGVQQYDVSLKPGVNPQAYANAISARLGGSYAASVTQGGGRVFAAVETLVTLLTLLIIAVAGLGVLNTVALQIRERAHDIGVFKSVGMTPRQTLAMILCSVAAVGLVAGIIAVPAGMYLHDGVVPTMAHAANSGIPASLLTVYLPWELVLLALAGLAIAIVGALGPASWAAGTRTAFALRAE
jgi:putative ABC transport system permease protein